MTTIPFTKHTSCGNNFVIVDETFLTCLPEREKPLFAERASDVCFGIGSDGLLVIQPCRADVLQKINNAYGYWDTPPAAEGCDFIFRLFESDGKEALACGNGLLCIASYLYQQYGIEHARIMTEVPLARPNVITIGTRPDGTRPETALSWTNLGHPRRTPVDVVPATGNERHGGQAVLIEGLEIKFRSHDLQPFTDATALSLSGHLIFTGEPHLVIFPDERLPSEIANTIFSSPTAEGQEKRRNFGTWLIDHIGNYINKHYQDRFPVGINVNFARFDKITGKVQYRCYERGVYRETLACGTGALAVAYIVKERERLTDNKVTVLPHRCTWHQPDAELRIEATAEGWLLQGSPVTLMEGKCVHVGTPRQEGNGKRVMAETSEEKAHHRQAEVELN